VTGSLRSSATAENQYGKDNPHLYGWFRHPESWTGRMGSSIDSGKQELGDVGSKSVDNDIGDGASGCGQGLAVDSGRVAG
jgi:hypothetical protein